MGEYKKSDLIKLIIQSKDDKEYLDEDIMHLLLNETITKDVNKIHDDKLTFGEKMADKMAAFAGSWVFIFSFAAILAVWLIGNIILRQKAFDPYPFILLNLVLSCIAAIQAPIIMMSQNRQEKKDRLRAQNDYKVNVKSELIVEDLHYKIDKIIDNQTEIINRLEKLEKTQR